MKIIYVITSNFVKKTKFCTDDYKYLKILYKYFIFIIGFLIFNTQIGYSQQEPSDSGPSLNELLEMDLEELLNSQTTKIKGGSGSLGMTLSNVLNDSKSKMKMYGYYSINFDQPMNSDEISTFDLHYFTLFFTAQITERFSAEIQCAYEHATEKVWARTALVDYKISDALIIRSGLFLLPCGDFNEYYDIDFINKMADRPYPNKEIAPSGWLDVGVQLRGKLGNENNKFRPFYSLYVVNGSLEGKDGGRIRKLRGSWRDTNNSNKAIGGNIGFTFNKSLSFSSSYYNGAYTEDGEKNLSIAGASLSFVKKKFSIFSEYQMAIQEYTKDTLGTNGELHKNGFYALASYNVWKGFEPVFRYDYLFLDADKESNKNRYTIGLNYKFNKVGVLKINYQFIRNNGVDVYDDMLLLQFAIAF